MEEILHKLYYDAQTGLQSKEKLYKKAKEMDKKITMKIVKEFLDKQATAQITKQHTIKKTDYATIISPNVRNNFQMDIMYLPDNKLNKNFKYLLTCIDVYSRYAIVKPLKNKTGDNVYKAFLDIMKESGLCKNLNVDLGSEFVYTPFKKYCDENGIQLWYSDVEQENKNAIIERFHRTLRNIILKYTIAFDKSYIKDLPKLIMNYNNTYHSTIHAIPFNVWNGKERNNQDIHYIQHLFSVGDKVRHLQKKKVFGKNSSTSSYTKQIYTITKAEGQSYYLDELTKPFKEHELVLAVGEELNNNYEEKAKEIKKKDLMVRRLRREGLDILLKKV